MRRILISILAALVLCLTARAQVWLYVCHHDSCEVYNPEHIDSITFHGDSFRIDGLPPYPFQQVDSMVLHRPADLNVEERGWWGDMREGESRFLAMLTIDFDDLHFDYHVRFTFTVHDSICQSAKCELLLNEEWQILMFVGEKGEATPTGGDGGDPYIYVKETLTGPRRYEIWKMGGAVLPVGCLWEAATDRLALSSDCSSILTGRPMGEVRQIVEAWLFQPFVRIENPYYHEN